MENKIIKIKSGVDIESKEFQDYYKLVNECERKNIFLDMAVEQRSQVLINPVVFNENDYQEINIDDISFIWIDNRIIGHTMYNVKKERFSMPLSQNAGNHLDKRLLDINGSLSFSKIEQCLLENIDIKDLLYQYIKGRINGQMEKVGIIEYEKSFKKQKN